MTVGNALIVGAGVSGAVAAIALAQRGVQVEIVEQASRWYGVGHGITVHGNALRALDAIGVADRIIAQGVPFGWIRVKDASGAMVAEVPTPATGGPDLPPTLGTLRSDLQAVLVDEVRSLGVAMRLGTRAVDIEDTADAAVVTFDDGSTGSYDVVIGADGIRSTTRALLGFDERPAPTGMGIWRFVTERTPEMDSSAVFYGGPFYKAGYAPISDTQCYGYVLIDPTVPEERRHDTALLKTLLEGYHGDFDLLRESITPDTFSNYQPVEWLLVDRPWHRGRTVIIGDAAHACPPLIAQGAAMCAEDAVLLAEHLTAEGAGADVAGALQAFWERRIPRVRMVVESSMTMVDWELHPATPDADPPGLMASSLALLTAAA